jgi:putative restriction endonuclease
MISLKPVCFGDCGDIWNLTSIERLQDLYEFTVTEKTKGKRSIWCLPTIPPSYLQNGFCSAAIKQYQQFLIEFQYEDKLVNIFRTHNPSKNNLASKLELEIDYPKRLLADYTQREGKDIIREVKTRSGQRVFRKMVLQIYSGSCCITGLNIPEVNRASHIVPWAENEISRLDPSNGLCLSATYDAAFDRNLISLDDDYRIIVSIDIKDHYTSHSVEEHFLKKEGNKITIPNAYKPQLIYLDKHRKAGNF